MFYDPTALDTSITDADGNVYTSVIIGTQEWMSENLRTTKYSDGTVIPNVTSNSDWESLSTGAWCNYDNSSTNDATYGKLYNWYAVNTSKLCPTGWHVPTDAEWTVLTDYLTANGHNGTEGTALKSTSGWNSGGNGTDDYGFLGLPGGLRPSDGGFYLVGFRGYWWSSSQRNTNDAWTRYAYSANYSVSRSITDKGYGFSVRCLRDYASTSIQGDSLYLVKENDVLSVYATTDIDSIIFYVPSPLDTTITTSQVKLENGETPLEIYLSGVPIDSIIGKAYQGGLIAYLDTLDGTGIIAAPTDQGEAEWGCYGTSISGADGTEIGTGDQNTADILAGCSETNIAAYRCDTLTLGGYNDWFLPSKDELNKLYENIGQGNALGLGNVAGFANNYYWSSTEGDNDRAWFQNFNSNYQTYDFKFYDAYYVRAVRAF